ncbi:MAG: MBL fold metallo-hydrolase [Bermanella sp.]
MMSQQTIQNLIYARHDQPSEGCVIHMLTSTPRSFLTNAYLIETENAVVAVDTFMIVPDAQALRELLNSIGKPLIAIIITHGHPDHYNGTATLLEGFKGVPVISTQGITDCIRDSVDAKEVKWKPFFGDEWPSEKILPNQWVKDGETLTLDGLDYYFRDLGAAESSSDLYFTLGPKKSVVFVGDVVFNQMHGFMNDGHSLQWLSVLKQLADELKDVNTLFTGHGQPGNPVELIIAQIKYVSVYQREVAAQANGAQQLTIEQKTKLEERMCKAFPHYQLSGFIQAGADSVAHEIAVNISIL